MKISTLDIDFFEDMKNFFESESMKDKNITLYASMLDEKFNFEKQNAVQIIKENQKRINDVDFANAYFNVLAFSKLRTTAIEIKESIIERYKNYTGMLEGTNIASSDIGDETESFIKDSKVWIESIDIHFLFKLSNK